MRSEPCSTAVSRFKQQVESVPLQARLSSFDFEHRRPMKRMCHPFKKCDWLKMCISKRISSYFRWKLVTVTLLVSTSSGAGEWEYSMRMGDTLFALAKTHMSDESAWSQIEEFNSIADVRDISINKTIKIPFDWLRFSATHAIATAVRGTVDLTHAGESSPVSVNVGDHLKQGDLVLTGKQGSITISYPDESIQIIQPNSALLIKQLVSHGLSSSTRIRTELIDGRIENIVEPMKTDGSRFETGTPGVAVGVRGTVFRTATQNEGSYSQVEVLDGLIDATKDSRSVSLSSGYGVTAKITEEIGKPYKLLAAPDISYLSTLIEAPDISFILPMNPDIQAYRVQLFTDQTATDLLLDKQVTDNSITWVVAPDSRLLSEKLRSVAKAENSRLADGFYTLRIRGVNTDKLEGFDSTLEFELNARPDPPYFRSPQNGAIFTSNYPSFSWAKIKNAYGYYLQIARDPQFTDSIAGYRSHPNHLYFSNEEFESGDYYWRLASQDINGKNGPVGEIRMFTIEK